jgi:hypothetical protein
MVRTNVQFILQGNSRNVNLLGSSGIGMVLYWSDVIAPAQKHGDSQRATFSKSRGKPDVNAGNAGKNILHPTLLR